MYVATRFRGAVLRLAPTCRAYATCTHEDGPLQPASDTEVRMAGHVEGLLTLLGEDPTREGLQKTPMRVAKALRFLTSGMQQDLGTIVNQAVFAEEHDEMVIVRNIDLYSLCEHHMLPFAGKCHIAYVPDGNVIGLSKLGRITDLFARRLQVQERLTKQVAGALMDALSPLGVGVVIEATHMCMAMRGVEKTNATTITTCMMGSFRDDPRVRNEFISLLGLPSPTGSAGVTYANLDDHGAERGSGGGSGGGGVYSHQHPKSDHDSCCSPQPSKQEEQNAQAVVPQEGQEEQAHVSTISLFKEDMKFSCGHFTIFGAGERERLHGHNYAVQVSLTAPVPAGPPGGMVTDYNVYKRAARAVCAELDEFVLLPGLSPHLKVSEDPARPATAHGTTATPSISVEFQRGDGTGSGKGTVDMFQFPASDVIVLPVSNITLEELSRHVCNRLVQDHGETMRQQMVSDLSVSVSSGPGQTAEYRCSPLAV